VNILKEILSADSLYKAIICQREDGIIDVVTMKWAHEFVPGHGEVCDPFWERVGGPSLTDTLENAEKIAKEEMRNWSGQSADAT
jgi:hypothetical protein